MAKKLDFKALSAALRRASARAAANLPPSPETMTRAELVAEVHALRGLMDQDADAHRHHYEKRRHKAAANASGSRMGDPMAVLRSKVKFMEEHNGSERGWIKVARIEFGKDGRPCDARTIRLALRTALEASE